MLRRAAGLIVVFAAIGSSLSGCGGDGKRHVVLLTHDSFLLGDDVLASFTERTGIELQVRRAGDAGSMLNQAILTKRHPLGDVLYGVDSTFLSRALDEDLFLPYEARGLDQVPSALVLDAEHRVTPIDVADVCLNYDIGWFSERDLEPPRTIDDLLRPEYEGLTVVEDPATSSPGLAFLLATIGEHGDAWHDFWRVLRENRVLVVDGWEAAYNGAFTAGGGSGDRPIVVSYASSPPADVVYADPPKDEPSIGVVEASCYRQVELAGVLRGTGDESAARELVDFLLSLEVQEDLPLQMFVFPARRDAELPDVFERFAARPDQVIALEPRSIDVNRDRWIDEWTDLVVR